MISVYTKEVIVVIADKIREARIGKKYTQEQAAEELKVSRQTVSNWENGKTLTDIVSVIRMSELYKVSLDELIKGDKMMMEKIEKDTFAIQREKKIIRFAWISIALGIIMLVIGNVFDGNPVIDFIEGALPWMLLALTILFEILYLNKEDRK